MATTTEPVVIVSGDVAIEKRETFDVDTARWLLEQKERLGRVEREALQRYYKARKNGNQHDTLYKLGKDVKHEHLGRFVAKGGIGLQCLPRDIRAALAQKYYWDVDMRNAQPTLLAQYATTRGWICEKVKHYITYREELLTEMETTFGIERWEAKDRITALCFGMTPSPDRYTPFFVDEFQPEMAVLMRNVFTEVKEQIGTVAKRGVRSVMAFVLQTEERKVLLAMEASLAKQGRALEVYIHDGGLVRKKEGETHLPDEVLRKVERDVESATGYKISLAVKEMKTTYERDDEDEEGLISQDILINDAYAAERFAELMGDLFAMDNGMLWVFNPETGLWGYDKATLERVITALNGKLVFRQRSDKGIRTFDYSGSVEKRNALIRMLPSKAPIRDGFFRSKRQSDVGKLLFVDGIYDFKTDTFTKGFDPAIVFTARMPRPFPTEPRRRDLMDFILHQTFKEPFAPSGQPTTGDERTLLHELMRAAYGDFTRKKLVIGLGPHDCSKGMTTILTTSAFGSYVQSFNGNSLLHKSFSGESERDYTFALKFVNSRFAFSSEIRVPKDEKSPVAVDGTLLKTLASGGDDIEARRLYESPVQVYNKAQLFVFANDMPKISPSADCVSSKIVPVNWSVSFVEDPQLPTEKKRDAAMSDLYKQPEYGEAFFWILVEEYARWKASGFKEIDLPETARQGLEDLMPAKRLGPLLVEAYELTKSPLDVVPFDDIREWVKGEGWEGTDNKLGRELTAMGLGMLRRRERGKVSTYRTGLRSRIGNTPT
jgi:hypothetical protein